MQVGGEWHAGWNRHHTTVPGNSIWEVKSSIEEKSPYVEVSGTRTPAWVGLDNRLTYPNDRWAEGGWMQYYTGERRIFYEWVDGSGFAHYEDGPNPAGVGSFTDYDLFWDGVEFAFYVQGLPWAYSPRSFTIRNAGMFGETKTLNSQMPGVVHNNEKFASSIVRNANGAAYPFDGVGGGYADAFATNPNIHGFGKVGTYRVDIWDRACP
jgi:hypothetical protein